MIIDDLKTCWKYDSCNLYLRKAFDFLQSPKLINLPDGRYEIDGEKVFANVFRQEGKGHDGAKLEVHNKYIDIHFIVSGIDEIGWKVRSSCKGLEGEFNEKDDYQLFTDLPSMWINIISGQFAIFFPEDGHSPGRGNGLVHKVVVKVATI